MVKIDVNWWLIHLGFKVQSLNLHSKNNPFISPARISVLIFHARFNRLNHLHADKSNTHWSTKNVLSVKYNNSFWNKRSSVERLSQPYDLEFLQFPTFWHFNCTKWTKWISILTSSPDIISTCQFKRFANSNRSMKLCCTCATR